MENGVCCCCWYQSPSCVQFFMTPWTAAHQASLSFTISQSLPKLMSIELVMPSNHLILCCPLLLLPSIALTHIIPTSFPASGSFPMSQLFLSGGQSIGASASASVLLMNIQGRFPLGLTVLNNDALNTEVNVFFQISVFVCLVLAYIARSGIAGSYGSFSLHRSQPCRGKGVCITQ